MTWFSPLFSSLVFCSPFSPVLTDFPPSHSLHPRLYPFSPDLTSSPPILICLSQKHHRVYSERKRKREIRRCVTQKTWMNIVPRKRQVHREWKRNRRYRVEKHPRGTGTCSFGLLYVATASVLTYEYGIVKIWSRITLGQFHFKSELKHICQLVKSWCCSAIFNLYHFK